MPAGEINYWKYISEGDKNAFLYIYNKYYKALFQYGFALSANKELTKDCIQELFLEIWNKRSATNQNVIDVKSYLFTWLRRKISRSVSRELKEKNSESERPVVENEESSYEDLLIALQGTEEVKERLAKALKCLTRKQVEIIKLKFFDNLTYEEIAVKTSLATRTVYNTIYEALRHLREDVTLLV